MAAGHFVGRDVEEDPVQEELFSILVKKGETIIASSSVSANPPPTGSYTVTGGAIVGNSGTGTTVYPGGIVTGSTSGPTVPPIPPGSFPPAPPTGAGDDDDEPNPDRGSVLIWQEDGMTYAQISGSRLVRGVGAGVHAALASLSESVAGLLDFVYGSGRDRPALHPDFLEEIKELKEWSKGLGLN